MTTSARSRSRTRTTLRILGAFAVVSSAALGMVGCFGSASGPAPAPPPAKAPTAGVAVTETALAVDADRDWPWWRGPNRDAVATCDSAPTEWNATKNVLWEAPVPGRGHASPIVVGDSIYLATAKEDTGEQLVVAYDRETGDVRWEKVLRTGDLPKGIEKTATHANGTIACDGERVFVTFLGGGKVTLFAVDLAGEEVWQADLGQLSPKFCYAPSPAIWNSIVIVSLESETGSSLVAIDRESGERAWSIERPDADTYASPIVAEVAGEPQIAIAGGRQFASYDPRTGERKWAVGVGADIMCGTAAFDDERFYASGGYPQRGTFAISADGAGEIVWENNHRVYESSPVYYDGLVFGVQDDGIAFCWDAKTGEERWAHRLKDSFMSSPVICGGNVYVGNLRGKQYVFRATGDGYEEVAVNELGTDLYATPTICDGRIYLRIGDDSSGTRKERLVCIGEK